jgi:hypothetical protein
MSESIAQNAEKSAERKIDTLFSYGDRVTVVDASGRPLERRVWGVAETVVYVCTERLFRALEEGRERTTPIGFPKDDVVAAI